MLLLNASLTTEAFNSNAHSKFWKQTGIIDSAIKALNVRNKPVVYLLWGGFAKKYIPLIDTTNALIITSVHPSPLSANRAPYFKGHHQFSRTNQYLKEHGLKPIDWRN